MRIRRNRKYVYLIHYKFINGQQEARLVLTRTKPIKTFEDVESIEKYLDLIDKAAIMSYQLMSVK